MGEAKKGWLCWAGAEAAGEGGWLREAREEEGPVAGSKWLSLQTSFRSHQEGPKGRICAVHPEGQEGGVGRALPGPGLLLALSPPSPTDRRPSGGPP